jgi:hydrogenase maturation protease
MTPRRTTPTDDAREPPWIVGLGTNFGDDRVGWEVIARFRESRPADTEVLAVTDPLAVLDAPPGCGLLVVIDACRGAGAPGSIHRIEWPDQRLAANGETSSHGIGLTAALGLAAALGRLPSRVVVFAVEGVTTNVGGGMSRMVEAAIPEIVERVTAELSGRPDGGRE